MSSLLKFKLAYITCNRNLFDDCIEDMKKEIVAVQTGIDYIYHTYSLEDISLDVIHHAQRQIADAKYILAEIAKDVDNIEKCTAHLGRFTTTIDRSLDGIVNCLILSPEKVKIGTVIAEALNSKQYSFQNFCRN